MKVGDLCEIRCVSWDADVGHFVASRSVKYPVLFRHDTGIHEFIVQEVDLLMDAVWGTTTISEEGALIKYILRHDIDSINYKCILFNKESDVWARILV